MIREKNIISGNMFEAEFYPVFEKSGRKIPNRKAKQNPSSQAQINLNDKNARKKLQRLLETNFKIGDLVLHGTYRDSEMPATEEECRRDIQNYIRRAKRYRKKHGLDEMKYIYVIEAKVSKRTGLVRYHFHMIMNEMERTAAESIWYFGEWTNADRLQPGEKGLEALAKYLVKKPEGSRRWNQSKNLKKPIEKKPKDNKISKRYLEKLATVRADDAAYWENRYKGYRFIESEPAYNEVNGHWYLSVKMYKKDTEVRADEKQTLRTGERRANSNIPLDRIHEAQIPGTRSHVSHTKRRE